MAGIDELPHGGALDQIMTGFPDAPQPWIDLSTGINPWPYPDLSLPAEIFRALPTKALQANCAAAMGRQWRMSPDYILPIAGSELLIRHLPLFFGKQIVGLPRWSYEDHARAWRASGAEIQLYDDPQQLLDDVSILVVVNPNNPDGRLYSKAQMEEYWQRMQAKAGWLIVDEAYIDMCPEHSLAAHAGAPGLIVMRSTGKFYGLAGLRLGALLASDSLLSWWRDFSGHWAVSGPALALGARIYDDRNYADQMRAQIQAQSQQLQQILLAGRCEIVGSAGLFTLIKHPEAGGLWQSLCEAGIYTRKFPAHPEFLRVGLPADTKGLGRLAEFFTHHL